MRQPSIQGPQEKIQDYKCSQAAEALIRLLQQTDGQVLWEEFLPVFEGWCGAQEWEVEYGAVEDGSCAIFSRLGHPWDEAESRSA